jgi:hypothetical protein
MAAVVAAVVCCGCAFSGGATASVVDDMGGGRDRAPRPFDCRAVIITRVRLAVSAWWGPSVSGRRHRL